MTDDYVFERTWWLFAAWQILVLVLYLALLGFCAYLNRAQAARLRVLYPKMLPAQRSSRRLTLLTQAIICSPLSAAISWNATSQYFTRFDHDGIHLPGALGYGSKPWSEVRDVFLAPSERKSTLCIGIEGGFIHFDSSVFADPELVVRALQAEVQRHRKRL